MAPSVAGSSSVLRVAQDLESVVQRLANRRDGLKPQGSPKEAHQPLARCRFTFALSLRERGLPGRLREILGRVENELAGAIAIRVAPAVFADDPQCVWFELGDMARSLDTKFGIRLAATPNLRCNGSCMTTGALRLASHPSGNHMGPIMA